MDNVQELIERTQWLQDEVGRLRDGIGRIESQLQAYEELLTEKLLSRRLTQERADGQTRVSGTVTAKEPAPDLGSADELERRTTPRRRGNPVSVQVAHPEVPTLVHGWAVDRSPEGLCLVTEEAVPVGTFLKVRPTDHPVDPAWFDIEVRNCRAERNIWILGCHFPQPLSWSDLRLFS